MKKLNHILYASLILGLLSSCGSGEEKMNGTPEAGNSDPVVMVGLNPEQIQEAGIRTGSLEKRVITDWVQGTGMVDLPPSGISAIFPKHEGYISDIHVLAGSQVKKGEVLGWLEHADLVDMQMDYIKKQDEFSFLDSMLKRETELASAQAIPEKQLKATRLSRDKARLEWMAMEKKLRIIGMDPDRIRTEGPVSRVPLRSGISGFVEQVGVHPGMYVTPETQCFRIFSPDHQHIELTLFREQITRVKKGQKVLFRVHGDPEEHDGELFLVRPALDPGSTTSSVHIHFDESSHPMMPGTRVDARIAVETDSAYTLPKEEFVRVGDRYRIFLQKDGQFVPVWVETDREGEDWIEITGPSDLFMQTVVLTGNYYLQGSL